MWLLLHSGINRFCKRGPSASAWYMYIVYLHDISQNIHTRWLFCFVFGNTINPCRFISCIYLRLFTHLYDCMWVKSGCTKPQQNMESAKRACITTMTSLWARWHLKSPAAWLFTQAFILAQIKQNIKAPHHWPLWGEFTGDRWIPRTKGQ